MDRGAWRAEVHGVAGLDTTGQLSIAQHIAECPVCGQKNLESSSGPTDDLATKLQWNDYLLHFGRFVVTHTTSDEEIGLFQLLATVGGRKEERGRKKCFNSNTVKMKFVPSFHFK